MDTPGGIFTNTNSRTPVYVKDNDAIKTLESILRELSGQKNTTTNRNPVVDELRSQRSEQNKNRAAETVASNAALKRSRVAQNIMNENARKNVSALNGIKNAFVDGLKSLTGFLSGQFKDTIKTYSEFSSALRKNSVDKNLAKQFGREASVTFGNVAKNFGVNLDKKEIRNYYVQLKEAGMGFEKLTQEQKDQAILLMNYSGKSATEVIKEVRTSSKDTAAFTKRLYALTDSNTRNVIQAAEGLLDQNIINTVYGGDTTKAQASMTAAAESIATNMSTLSGMPDIAAKLALDFDKFQAGMLESGNANAILIQDIINSSDSTIKSSADFMAAISKNIEQGGSQNATFARFLATSNDESAQFRQALSVLESEFKTQGELNKVTAKTVKQRRSELEEITPDGKIKQFISSMFEGFNAKTGLISGATTELDYALGDDMDSIVSGGFNTVIDVLKSILFGLSIYSASSLFTGSGKLAGVFPKLLNFGKNALPFIGKLLGKGGAIGLAIGSLGLAVNTFMKSKEGYDKAEEAELEYKDALKKEAYYRQEADKARARNDIVAAENYEKLISGLNLDKKAKESQDAFFQRDAVSRISTSLVDELSFAKSEMVKKRDEIRAKQQDAQQKGQTGSAEIFKKQADELNKQIGVYGELAQKLTQLSGSALANVSANIAESLGEGKVQKAMFLGTGIELSEEASEALKQIAKNGVKIDVDAMANGGIVSRATPSIVGEAGKEAILPLTKPSRLTTILDALSDNEKLIILKALLGYGSTSGQSQSSNATVADAAIAFARSQIGKPYSIYSDGYVCNTLVQAAFKNAGLTIPSGTVKSHWNNPRLHKVPIDQAVAGMIGFSNLSSTTGYPQHMGIITGDGTWINASGSSASFAKGKFKASPNSKGVIESAMEMNRYWKMVGAGYYDGMFDVASGNVPHAKLGNSSIPTPAESSMMSFDPSVLNYTPANGPTSITNQDYQEAVARLAQWQGGRLKPAEFIKLFGPIAREDMRLTGIPASITLAQAALESGWGKTAKAAFRNLFGIKGKGNAGSAYVGTHEIRAGGVREQKMDYFAQYNSYLDSVNAHSNYLLNAKRKSGLRGLRYGDALMHIFEPNLFAHKIKEGGYATSPTYADKLISLMQTHNLYGWDVGPNELALTGINPTAMELINQARLNAGASSSVLANQSRLNDEAVNVIKHYLYDNAAISDRAIMDKLYQLNNISDEQQIVNAIHEIRDEIRRGNIQRSLPATSRVPSVYN